MPSRLILCALLLSVAGMAAGQLRLVASIEPYGDLARQVGGEQVEVSVMLPAGVSPHTFEPSPRDAALLNDADLVILNGGTDEWLHEMVEAVAPEVPVVEAMEVLEGRLEGVLEEDVGHDEEHAEHDEAHDEVHDAHGDAHDEVHDEEHGGEAGHHHFGPNPHVWLDPVLAIEVVNSIAESLAELDAHNVGLYRERADQVVADLRALDAELKVLLAPVAGAPFIPFHDAWPYFAHRYGLDLILEIEPFAGREPSPRYLAEVVETIHSSGAPAIFSEVGLNDRPALVLADEAGVSLFRLDPLGNEQESYQDLLRRNAATILEALLPWEPRQ